MTSRSKNSPPDVSSNDDDSFQQQIFDKIKPESKEYSEDLKKKIHFAADVKKQYTESYIQKLMSKKGSVQFPYAIYDQKNEFYYYDKDEQKAINKLDEIDKYTEMGERDQFRKEFDAIVAKIKQSKNKNSDDDYANNSNSSEDEISSYDESDHFKGEEEESDVSSDEEPAPKSKSKQTKKATNSNKQSQSKTKPKPKPKPEYSDYSSSSSSDDDSPLSDEDKRNPKYDVTLSDLINTQVTFESLITYYPFESFSKLRALVKLSATNAICQIIDMIKCGDYMINNLHFDYMLKVKNLKDGATNSVQLNAVSNSPITQEDYDDLSQNDHLPSSTVIEDFQELITELKNDSQDRNKLYEAHYNMIKMGNKSPFLVQNAIEEFNQELQKINNQYNEEMKKQKDDNNSDLSDEQTDLLSELDNQRNIIKKRIKELNEIKNSKMAFLDLKPVNDRNQENDYNRKLNNFLSKMQKMKETESTQEENEVNEAKISETAYGQKLSESLKQKLGFSDNDDDDDDL